MSLFGRVFVFDSVLFAFSARHQLSPDRRDGLFRCVLAHELVHALQHQTAPRPDAEGALSVDVQLLARRAYGVVVARITTILERSGVE